MSDFLSKEQQNQICREFAKHQTHNFKFEINSYEKAIIIVGKSGVGKSAYAHMLKDPKSVAAIENPKIQGFGEFILVTKKLAEGQDPIGQEKTSKTYMPNFYIVRQPKLMIIDCPGFLDSGGTKMNLINSNIMTKLFESVNNIRIHLCIQEKQITSSKSTDIKISLRGLLSYFAKTQENLAKIYKATTLVITKRSPISEEALKAHIKLHIDKFDKQKQRDFINILNNSEIEMKSIPLAKSQQQPFQQALSQQILKSELKKDFYKIDYNKGFDLSFGNKQCINEMYTEREIHFMQACKVLNQSVKIVIQKNKQIDSSTAKKIQVLMKQFIKDRDIYDRCDRKIFIDKIQQRPQRIQGHINAIKRNFECFSGSDLIKLNNIGISEYQKDFNWVIFFQCIRLANQKFKQHQKTYQHDKKSIQEKHQKQKKQKKTFPRIFSWIKGTQNQNIYTKQSSLTVFMVTCIQNCIYNYVIKCLPEAQIQFFFDFMYIVWRIMQEMEIITNKKIDVPKKTKEAWKILQISYTNLYHKYYQYIMNYKARQAPNENYLICFQEILNLSPDIFAPYQKVEKKSKAQNDVTKIKQGDYVSKRSYDLIKIHAKRGKIMQSQGNNKQALLQLQQARMQLQQRYKAQNNFEAYSQIGDDIYHKMAEICSDLQLFELKIQYLLVFGDNAMIEQSYEQLKKSEEDIQKNYKICLKQVNFFISISKHDAARSLVEKLYSSTYKMANQSEARSKRIYLANYEKRIENQKLKFIRQSLKNQKDLQNQSLQANSLSRKYKKPNQQVIKFFFKIANQTMASRRQNKQQIPLEFIYMGNPNNEDQNQSSEQKNPLLRKKKHLNEKIVYQLISEDQKNQSNESNIKEQPVQKSQQIKKFRKETKSSEADAKMYLQKYKKKAVKVYNEHQNKINQLMEMQNCDRDSAIELLKRLNYDLSLLNQ